MIDWQPIKDAVGMVATGNAKQVKNEEWTVYATESCIRLDIFIKPKQGERSAHSQHQPR